MNKFKFRFVLADSRSNRKSYVDFTSSKEHILDAWKEAAEYAWGEVNQHDTNWYIKEIINVR